MLRIFAPLCGAFCLSGCICLSVSALAQDDVDVGELFLSRMDKIPDAYWTQVENFGDRNLRVFEWDTSTQKRWLAVARLGETTLEARMTAVNKRMTTSKQSVGCRVAVNAGYFDMNTGASSSIYVRDGQLIGKDERDINRGGGRIGNPTRAVLGLEDDAWQMRWARSAESRVLSFSFPADPWASPSGGELWSIDNGVGGGPMLLVSGARRITAAEELFDAASGVDPNGRHGRSAVGIGSDGLAFLLVVDGRRSDAVGASMSDLSDMMLSFGATSAMNLDGGGSSTFVMNGVVLNRPSDGSERPVSTILCLE